MRRVRRLPTLDTNIWMEGGRVLNTFFEKEMSAKRVIHRDTERMLVVNKLTRRMANSGYIKDQARKVIVFGLRGYETARKRAAKTDIRMHKTKLRAETSGSFWPKPLGIRRETQRR